MVHMIGDTMFHSLIITNKNKGIDLEGGDRERKPVSALKTNQASFSTQFNNYHSSAATANEN